MSVNLLANLQSLVSGKWMIWVAFCFLAAVSAIADLTKFSDLPLQFIGHADQANMAIVARNIAEGNGAVVDVIWILTNGGIPGNEIPISEPYWSIYVASFIALFFLAFGAGLTPMLAAAVFTKVSVAAISCGITLRLSKSALPALSVAVLLLFLPVMTRSVTGLSDIYLTFFMLCTAIVLAHAIARKSLRLFFLVGLLIGIAIGVKPSGLLLLGLLLGYLLFSGQAVIACGRLAIAALGIVVGLLPLLIHNYQGFGSFLSPANGLVRLAARIRLHELNHNAGFFNPDPIAVGDYASTLGMRLDTYLWHLKNFSQKILDGQFIPLYLMPFVALGVYYAIRSIRSPFIYRGENWETNFSFISVQMLLAAIVLGGYVHWEARYWNFAVPFLIILSMAAITTMVKNKVVQAFACTIVIASTLWSFKGELERFRPKPISKMYEVAARILPPDAIVFANDPWEFSYHTRRRSIMLPYTDKDSSLISLSERYGAEYIAIIGKQSRHPRYREFAHGNFPDYLEPVMLRPRLTVLKFKPGSEAQL